METFITSANRGSVSTGYDITHSVKLEDNNDEWLYRTNAIGTNRKTWTMSCWFKMSNSPSLHLGHAIELWQGGVYGEATRVGVFGDDRIWVDIGGGLDNTGTLYRSLSAMKLRDLSAWYHLVVASDSTQGTEANRLKVYLNGEEVTEWDQRQYPAQNFQSALQGGSGGSSVDMKWGSYNATYHGVSGYLAECNYIDGIMADQDDFGEFDEDTGIWKPKQYTGSYGTNGSYLDFSDSSDMGANAKGNDTNFSLNNIAAADQSTDTPTNNFAIINGQWDVSSYTTYSEGGTKAVIAAGWQVAVSTIAPSSGKWYFEHQRSSGNSFIGIVDVEDQYIPRNTQGYFLGYNDNAATNSLGMYSVNGQVYNSPGGTPDGVSFTTSNIIGVAVDLDNRRLYFASDNTWAGSMDPAAGSGGVTIPSDWPGQHVYFGMSGSSSTLLINFGGFTNISTNGKSDANGYGTFKYDPPSGYYSLCTKNLAEFGG